MKFDPVVVMDGVRLLEKRHYVWSDGVLVFLFDRPTREKRWPWFAFWKTKQTIPYEPFIEVYRGVGNHSSVEISPAHTWPPPVPASGWRGDSYTTFTMGGDFMTIEAKHASFQVWNKRYLNPTGAVWVHPVMEDLEFIPTPFGPMRNPCL